MIDPLDEKYGRNTKQTEQPKSSSGATRSFEKQSILRQIGELLKQTTEKVAEPTIGKLSQAILENENIPLPIREYGSVAGGNAAKLLKGLSWGTVDVSPYIKEPETDIAQKISTITEPISEIGGAIVGNPIKGVAKLLKTVKPSNVKNLIQALTTQTAQGGTTSLVGYAKGEKTGKEALIDTATGTLSAGGGQAVANAIKKSGLGKFLASVGTDVGIDIGGDALTGRIPKKDASSQEWITYLTQKGIQNAPGVYMNWKGAFNRLSLLKPETQQPEQPVVKQPIRRPTALQNIDMYGIYKGKEDIAGDVLTHKEDIEAAEKIIKSIEAKKGKTEPIPFNPRTREQVKQSIAKKYASIKTSVDALNKGVLKPEDFTDILIRKEAELNNMGREIEAQKLYQELLKEKLPQQEYNNQMMKSDIRKNIFEVLKKKYKNDKAMIQTKMFEIVDEMRGVNWNDKEAVTDFYRKYVKPTAGQKMKTYFYGNLLSSPKTTLLVNPIANAVRGTIVRPTEIALTEGPVAAAKYVGGLIKNIPTGINAAKEALSGQTPSGEYSAYGEYGDRTTDIPMYSKKEWGGVKRLYEEIWTTSKKLLKAADEMARATTGAGEKAAMDYKISKGKSYGTKEETALELQERIDRNVYAEKIQPGKTGAINEGINFIGRIPMMMQQHPVLAPFGFIMAPFARIATNLIKRNIAYSPIGLGNLAYTEKKRMALTIAQSAIGMATTLGQLLLVKNGLVNFTTSYSTDKEKREREMVYSLPTAFRVGNTFLSYAQLPSEIAGPSALTSAIIKAFDEKKIGIDKAQIAMNALADYIKFNYSNSTMKQQQVLLDAISGGMSSESAKKQLAVNAVRTVVPMSSMQSFIMKFFDKLNRDPNQVDGSFIKKLMFSLAAKTPLASREVPPREVFVENKYLPPEADASPEDKLILNTKIERTPKQNILESVWPGGQVKVTGENFRTGTEQATVKAYQEKEDSAKIVGRFMDDLFEKMNSDVNVIRNQNKYIKNINEFIKRLPVDERNKADVAGDLSGMIGALSVIVAERNKNLPIEVDRKNRKAKFMREVGGESNIALRLLGSDVYTKGTESYISDLANLIAQKGGYKKYLRGK